MATKLKGLEVGKVDFVDEGANQRADIKLLKGKNKAEETSDPEIGLFKRFLNWISGEVQKSATTFDEQINDVRMDAIRDEIWSVCYALQNSLNSILCDPELDSSGKPVSYTHLIRRSQNEGIPGTVPESIWTLYQRCEERRTPWTISCQHHLGPCIG